MIEQLAAPCDTARPCARSARRRAAPARPRTGRAPRWPARAAAWSRAPRPATAPSRMNTSCTGADRDRNAPGRSSPTGPGAGRRTTPRRRGATRALTMFANNRALSALPSARLVNSEPPAHSSTRPVADLLLEQRAFAICAARQREHEVVVGHAQRPFVGFVVGFELQRLHALRATHAARWRSAGSFRAPRAAAGVGRFGLLVWRGFVFRLLARRAHPPPARVATAACRRAAPRAPCAFRTRSRSAIRFRPTAPEERRAAQPG